MWYFKTFLCTFFKSSLEMIVLWTILVRISLVFSALRGLRLFKGLRLLIFVISYKATFIWEATFIRDLRVLLFFYFNLEKNSSSPGGADFYRPDLPGSGGTLKNFPRFKTGSWRQVLVSDVKVTKYCLFEFGHFLGKG